MYKNKARGTRYETPDERRRRWQREQRKYEGRQAQRERERLEEEERCCHAEQARLASRTPEELAADQADEERIAAWRGEAEAKRQQHQEWLDRREAERRSPYSTFGT